MKSYYIFKASIKMLTNLFSDLFKKLAINIHEPSKFKNPYRYYDFSIQNHFQIRFFAKHFNKEDLI